jgi:hypothetical protein
VRVRVRAQVGELLEHQRRGVDGHDDGGGPPQRLRGRCTGQPGITPARAVEVDGLVGPVGTDGPDHEVADTAGLERGRRLQRFQLQVDVAGERELAIEVVMAWVRDEGRDIG